MLKTFTDLMPDEKSRNVVTTVGGMLGVLAGRKLTGLALFGKGISGLERDWRNAHPDFQGGLEERWRAAVDFYRKTHENDANRTLHVIGIPLIVGGSAGLLLFNPYRPLWFLSATSFSAGWVLNFIGHGLFEKKAPAFADDPLAFVAGPVWEVTHLLGKRKNKAGRVETVETDAGPITIINVEPAQPAEA